MTPVSEVEHNAAKGLARCDERLWNEFQKNVTGLRARQAAYLASLPQDAAGAIDCALSHLMIEDENGLPQGFQRAQHLSRALEVMLHERDSIFLEADTYEAAVWIAAQVSQDLGELRKTLEHCKNILRNPKKCAR